MFAATTPIVDEGTGTPTSDWVGLRGDTWYFTVAKTGLSGWTGRTWTAQLRANAADVSLVASLTVIDNTTPTDVSVSFKLQTDTIPVGKYVYDVQWHDPILDVTMTVLRGRVTIAQDVTRL